MNIPDDDSAGLTKSRLPRVYRPCQASYSALRAGKERLATLLADSSSARTKSIRLRGVDFAQELSEGLLKFAVQREADFTTLQKHVAASSEREIAKFLKNIEESDKWFADAEAWAPHCFTACCIGIFCIYIL